MNINGNKILITGSTGFIGTHLATRLVQLKGVHVRGLVKNRLIPTTRIDQLQVEKVFGDMTSVEDMRTATSGCDIVIHCAVGLPIENAIGTKAVIKAALENGVKKFIHLSSTAVFGYWPSASEIKDGRLCCNYSTNNYLNEYCYSKIESEKIAFSYYDSNRLPLVVLRLSNVFGPHSTFWTLNAIKMLRQECYTIINGGLTPSNTIYVDNVVDAIILAIKEDRAVGQALIISDENAISWKHFFSSYAQMLSMPNSPLETNSHKLRCQRRKDHIKMLMRQTSNMLKNKAFFEGLPKVNTCINSLISQTGNATIYNKFRAVTQNQSGIKNNPTENKAQEDLRKIPPIWLEKSFTLPYQFPIKKASDILGFKPKKTFDQGMKHTAQWLNDYQKKGVAFT